MTNLEARRLIRGAVADGMLVALFYLGAASILITVTANYFRPYDDTDFNGRRSGMEILTDCKTGLQYLSTHEGGLTPRLDQNATQIRKECK